MQYFHQKSIFRLPLLLRIPAHPISFYGNPILPTSSKIYSLRCEYTYFQTRIFGGHCLVLHHCVLKDAMSLLRILQQQYHIMVTLLYPATVSILSSFGRPIFLQDKPNQRNLLLQRTPRCRSRRTLHLFALHMLPLAALQIRCYYGHSMQAI